MRVAKTEGLRCAGRVCCTRACSREEKGEVVCAPSAASGQLPDRGSGGLQAGATRGAPHRAPAAPTRPRAGALLQSPAFLQQLLKFHVVPPEPVRPPAGCPAVSGSEHTGAGTAAGTSPGRPLAHPPPWPAPRRLPAARRCARASGPPPCSPPAPSSTPCTTAPRPSAVGARGWWRARPTAGCVTHACGPRCAGLACLPGVAAHPALPCPASPPHRSAPLRAAQRRDLEGRADGVAGAGPPQRRHRDAGARRGGPGLGRRQAFSFLLRLKPHPHCCVWPGLPSQRAALCPLTPACLPRRPLRPRRPTCPPASRSST